MLLHYELEHIEMREHSTKHNGKNSTATISSSSRLIAALATTHLPIEHEQHGGHVINGQLVPERAGTCYVRLSDGDPHRGQLLRQLGPERTESVTRQRGLHVTQHQQRDGS